MLQTKAIYNLLRLQAYEDPTTAGAPWALLDMRLSTSEELFSALEKYQVRLNKESFLEFALECETPEEMYDLFIGEAEENDHLYLLVFELWRRFLPEKQSLSIFFDELDFRIAQYDRGLMEDDEPIQEMLANLLEVLDENADTGRNPEEVLSAISEYCAHDILDFLYDYITMLLEQGDTLHASEMIEGFAVYGDAHWFEFFQMRLLGFADPAVALTAAHRLLEHDLELTLLSEMLRYFSQGHERELFALTLKKAAAIVKDQEEMADVLAILADYYRSLHELDAEKTTLKLLNSQMEGPVRPSDLNLLQTLIK